ncbi:MAG: hypothetical protein QM638_12930 [Nocardioides sp.]|uniref:hypothetical protein n=1 Tax=Nocardioides sp. TaxID=35761 RepID=UPI0039E64355
MSADPLRAALQRAEADGYRWELRHQPAAEHEFPDWVVLIHTPAGDTLFPTAIDDTEAEALRRAAARIEAHRRG